MECLVKEGKKEEEEEELEVVTGGLSQVCVGR